MTPRILDATTVARPALSHYVLRTADLDAAIDWYGTVLGMRVVYRADGGAALIFDGEHHRLALIEVGPGDATTSGPGLEHVAFKLASAADWLGTYQRLADAGITPEV